MLKFITEYFWIFFILGMLAGVFIPAASLITPYILYLLMFAFFLSCLKIDMKLLFKKIMDIKLVVYLTLMVLIVVPILLYLIFNKLLEFEYALAVLVLVVMPTGMMSPVYATIFRGDKELAVIIAVVTSLLCPITIPILVYLLIGVKTDINLIQVFISLSMVIFIPFVLSILLRKVIKAFIKSIRTYYSSISVIIIMILIAGAIAKVNVIEVIKTEKTAIIWPFIVLFILAILLHLIGYYITYKKGKKTKITSSIATAYMNSTLAIIFAAEFFGPKTLLLVTLYQFPVTIAIIGFGYVVKKYLYSSI